MNINLKVSKSIEINSTASSVWDALTNPEKIALYLYGTQTNTDWKKGSPITFQGEYNGTTYKDKGNVLENIKDKQLKYNYWSGFSGLEDKPENYFIVTYDIEEKGSSVVFTWTQEGFKNEESRDHTKSGLEGILVKIKELAESHS